MASFSRTALLLLALRLAPSDCLRRLLSKPSDVDPRGGEQFSSAVSESSFADQMMEEVMNVRCGDDPRNDPQESRSPLDACRGSCTLSDLTADAQKYCTGKHWDGSKCKHAVSSMRQMAWPHIKEIAGNLKKSQLNTTLTREREPHTKVFRAGGGYASKVTCRSDGGGAKLYYRHIWKDAGAAIIYNMQALGNGLVTGGGDWDINNRCKELTADRENAKAVEKPMLFTFVREPIGKFVAGYKEMSYRGLIDDVRGHKVGEFEHAVGFVDMVINGNCDNGHVLLQTSNMISQVCESKFDFIGHLENFGDDWKTMSEQAGCDSPIPWDSDAYHHESEEDTLGVGPKMMEALRAEGGKLMRILCWWMLPDYAVFNYELPAECASGPGFSAAYIVH